MIDMPAKILNQAIYRLWIGQFVVFDRNKTVPQLSFFCFEVSCNQRIRSTPITLGVIRHREQLAIKALFVDMDHEPS